jgi:HK97 family phage portal protein
MQMGLNNFFKKIFGGFKSAVNKMQGAFLLNSLPFFTNGTEKIYDISLARACIHSIAINCAKLQPKFMKNDIFQVKADLQYLIGVRPNEYMTTFDFIYKIVSNLYTYNNAFVFCRHDNRGNIVGFYPITYKNFTLLEYQEKFYAKFLCNNFEFVVPYEELIHLRRHFNEDDITGSTQTQVLKPTISLNNSIVESIVNGVRNSNRLQGILKASTLVSDDELEKKKQKFVDNYLDVSNVGGIAIIDNRLDFQQLKLDPVLIDEKQMEAVCNDLFRYYNVSENIIISNYNENEYNAFYNSVIEPLAIQLSSEFTCKIFTENGIKAGKKIIMSAERMSFANMDTRVKAIETLMPLGIFSINESRKIMELSDIENGDKHLVSLNYVDLDKANEYQLGGTVNE